MISAQPPLTVTQLSDTSAGTFEVSALPNMPLSIDKGKRIMNSVASDLIRGIVQA